MQKMSSTIDSEPTVSPKTVKYLEVLADSTNELFAKAVEYRQLIAESKTSLARQLYTKKLKKIVAKLDQNMALFSALEDGKNRRESLGGPEDAV